MFLAFPCIKTIRWTHGKKGILSHFWNLQSLDPTKQYVKKNGESWHVEFCWRWKLTLWVFLKIEPPSTLQSKRLNKCRKLTCGVIFAIYNLSSTPQNTKQYLQYMNKVDMLSRCFEVWMYSLHLPRSLLKRYAQHINQFGILSHCYVFSPLSPTKTLRSTYKTTWHHEPCLRCLFLPLEIITLNIWTKWNVISLIFVNSFSYSKPICWTCEEHWHLEPFLKLISPIGLAYESLL